MRGTDISQFKRVYRERNEGEFPDTLVFECTKESDLKYGENPNQQAALYTLDSIASHPAHWLAQQTQIRSIREDGLGKGGLSLTNWMDIARALDTLKYFQDPAVAIMKHNVVSGFALQNEASTHISEVYQQARDSDRRSNFGGTVVLNRPIDAQIVAAFAELYPRHIIDVVAAPGFEEGQLEALQCISKHMRIVSFSNLDTLPKWKGDATQGLFSIKELPTGRLALQDLYLTSIRSPKDWISDPMKIDKEGRKHIIARDPSTQEARDLLTAWYINIAGARSNGVVVVRNGVLIANGSGQVERVGAVEQAIVKGIQKAFDREGLTYDPLMGIAGYERLRDNPFQGAACASDAFFPFPDAVQRLGRMGVRAIVQPYGSIRDGSIIDEANRFNIAMPATLERCFGHF